MAKVLLREYYQLCPDGICDRQALNEQEQMAYEQGHRFLVGICQRAGVKNGNGRIYPEMVLKKEADRYQESISQRRALGELDHPESSVINLQNVSHLCTQLWWDGQTLKGKFEVLPTPAGNTLKALMQAGVQLGVSSRGLGSIRETRQGTIVEDDFMLICFDMVSEPSTPGAYMVTEAKRSLNAQYINEKKDKETRIKNALWEVLKG